jgi:hypothetical protein
MMPLKINPRCDDPKGSNIPIQFVWMWGGRILKSKIVGHCELAGVHTGKM